MRSEKAAALAFDNRHSMQPDLAARRRDTAHGAHERVDAGRQTFANVWSRIAVRLEPSNHTGDPQPPQNMTEDHGSDDIPTAGVEEHDAPQLGVRASRLEKIDERLRRLGLDHTVGYDHVGTMSPAFVRVERRDAETHRRAMILRRGRRDHSPYKGQGHDKRR